MLFDRSEIRAEVFAALDLWVRWKKSCNVWPSGYPRRTVEQQLRDGGGVLISGKGLKLETPADVVDVVQLAVDEMPREYRVPLEGKWLRHWTDSYTAKRLGASVPTMRRLLERAYVFVGGRLVG